MSPIIEMSSAIQEELIRVLHIDDDIDHLVISKRYIKKFEPAITIDTTTSPDEVLDQLESYDCIVSDYKMPRMNGIELAQKVREISEIPFILYTGQGSEEVASDAFNVGVNDYLRKENEPDHYRVLAKRIRAAYARNLAEKKHRESEERYRTLLENASDMIQSVKLNGEFEYVNSSWLETLGYSLEEVSGMNVFDVIHPDHQSHCMELFSKVIKGESARDIRTVFVAKDGRKVYVEGNAFSRFLEGKVIATHGFFHEVNERARAPGLS